MQSQDPHYQKLAIGLAMLAGFIDALGYLNLGGVFVSFMSGNSTRLAVDLIGRSNIMLALIPLAIIGLFVFGVMAGRVVRHYSVRKPSTCVLGFMSLMLISAGLSHIIGLTKFSIALLTFAMGSANNVFFRGSEVSVGVTYMTGTLVKFGQRLAGRLLGEKDSNWLPYFLLWAGLVSGALAGSAGYINYGFNILWAAIFVSLILTAISARIENKVKQQG